MKTRPEAETKFKSFSSVHTKPPEITGNGRNKVTRRRLKVRKIRTSILYFKSDKGPTICDEKTLSYAYVLISII